MAMGGNNEGAVAERGRGGGGTGKDVSGAVAKYRRSRGRYAGCEGTGLSREITQGLTPLRKNGRRNSNSSYVIQSHMAQKPMLRGEVGARALRVRSVSREEAWASAGVRGALGGWVLV